MKLVKKNFFNRDAITVARELIGKIIMTDSSAGVTSGRIVETEAYLGKKDKASHIYGGKVTNRSKFLLNPPCYVYIYAIYGKNYCFNILTGGEDGSSVFIRAIEPLDGIEIMKKRRGINDLKNLTNGPSKLCAALGLDRSLNGIDLCRSSRIKIIDDNFNNKNVVRTRRVNIDYAGEHRDLPYRFYIEGNKFVSVRRKENVT